MYISKKDVAIEEKEINSQGGIDPKTDEDMEKAKTADLITLPGGLRSEVIVKRFCNNESIQMFVTLRMCCGYWDHKGVRRPWDQRKEQLFVNQTTT